MAMAAVMLCGCAAKTPVETTAPAASETEAVTAAAVSQTEAQTAAQTEAAQTETENEYIFNAPSHKFTRENFPRMDGSTAAVPLGQAIASFLLNEDFDSVSDLCRFNRTTQSFRNLMNGDCDILVVGEPNASVYAEMEEAGFKYELKDIAMDALIFVVNENNPVDSLTTEQIRDIYSGKITNWKEVGGEDREIVAFQRNEGAGSQALIRKLIMGDTEMTDAPMEYVIGSMGELMSAVKNYDNSADAIGYSVYYYANDMKMATGLKIISVDGVEPSEETIRSRKYPHLNAYYCVIPSEPDRSSAIASARADGARAIMNWLVGEDGQKLTASMGYVSVTDVGKGKINKAENGNLYQVPSGKKPGELRELTVTNAGELMPYRGGALYENFGDGDSYIAGYMNGFFTPDGTILTDPVYSDITRISRWDSEEGTEVFLPVYEYTVSTEEFWNEEYDYLDATVTMKFAAADGSFVSEKTYGVISGQKDGILCLDSYDADAFDFYDCSGKLLFTEKEIIRANPAFDDGLTYWSSICRDGRFLTVGREEGTYILDSSSFELLAGPFESVGEFKDGTSLIFGENGEFLIDEEMNKIIPEGYDYILRLENGNFAGRGYDGTVTVLSHEGAEITKVPGGSSGISTSGYGFLVSDYDSESGQSSTMYYDFNGELLFADEEGVFNNNSGSSIISGIGNLNPNGTLSPTFDAGGVMLIDVVTGKKKYFKDFGNANPFYTMESQADLPYMALYTIGDRYEDDAYIIIDRNMNIVKEGNGGCYAVLDESEGKWYIVCFENYENAEFDIYTDTMEPYAEKVKNFTSVSGGLITRTTDSCFEADKPDGTAVFRYLFAAAKDD